MWMDGQTEKSDEANSHFSQFYERSGKLKKSLPVFMQKKKRYIHTEFSMTGNEGQIPKYVIACICNNYHVLLSVNQVSD
jgi:hypothetical protein